MPEILLVGSRAAELEALKSALAPLGYEISAAVSGDDALEQLSEGEVALVIIEAGADRGEALEAARLIKGRAPGREVPVLFLVADAPGIPGIPPRDQHAAPVSATAGGPIHARRVAEASGHERADGDPLPHGYWLGSIDYVPLEPDADLLRARLAGLAALEASGLALARSEALLRGAFEAAPIGKTVLDAGRRILRANPAFAQLLGRSSDELLGTDIADFAHPEDGERLKAALARVAAGSIASEHVSRSGFEVRLRASSGADAWASAYVSAIDPAVLDEPLLMIQWVDLASQRHAEQAQAELRLEHTARTQAEAAAERLEKLQLLTDALETVTLDELLPELALRLAEQFEAAVAEVCIDGHEGEDPVVVRAARGQVLGPEEPALPERDAVWHEMALLTNGTRVGNLRLVAPARAPLPTEERSLLAEFAERAAISIRRAQLHDREHQIAATLQRGLLPTQLPKIPGLELTAHYEPAGDVIEVGGDWYDAFLLRGGRLGFVLGDVAGKGIPAASTMGQIRSVTRAFALGEDQTRPPGDVLTRLNRHQLALSSEEMFTVLYAIIDPHQGQVAWANAGHPPPLLHRASGETHYLEGGDGLMGFENMSYADLGYPLGLGDTLIFYTDGLIERRGESLDAGLERLAAAVERGPHDPEALRRHIIAELIPRDQTPDDDMTIVVARMQ